MNKSKKVNQNITSKKMSKDMGEVEIKAKRV